MQLQERERQLQILALLASSRQRAILTRRIAALRLIVDPSGKRGLCFVQIGPNQVVEILGQGINDRTVQVRCQGKNYFVFWEDIRVIAEISHADSCKGENASPCSAPCLSPP